MALVELREGMTVMSADNISAILGGLTDGIVGAFLGFVGAYILFKLTQRQKIIEYEVSSISLLKLNLKVDDTIIVSVKKSILTGKKVDEGEIVQLIGGVYGFQISLTNIGNEDIEKIDNFEISFDKSTKIIKCETEPISTKGYDIQVERDEVLPNVLRVFVPYINAKEQIIIRIITTENKNSQCMISAHGVGIKTRSAPSQAFSLIYAIIILVAGYSIFTGILFIDDIQKKVFYDFIPYDIWHIVALLILIASSVIATLIFRSFMSKLNLEKKNKHWDYKLPRPKMRKK